MASASEQNRAFYDRTTDGSQEYWRKMAAPRSRVSRLSAVIEKLRPASVVDLGCGGGEFLDEIARAAPSAKLCGVDLSEPQLALNRKRRPGVDWRCFDLSLDLPEPTERFDIATASEVIEHLDEPERFLNNASRFVRPGGHLLLSTQSGRVGETERRVGHRRHFTAEALSSMLEQNGWKTLRVWNEGFPFHDLSKWYANLDPDASMRSFGEGRYGLYQNAVALMLRGLFRLNSRSRGAQLYAIAQKGTP